MASCHSDPEVCAPSRCHHIFRTDLFCGPFAGAQWNELFAFPLRSYILFFGRALARWLGSVCTCPPLAWWCQRGQRRGQQEEAGRTLLPVGENHAIGVSVPALAHVCHVAITGLGLSFPHPWWWRQYSPSSRLLEGWCAWWQSFVKDRVPCRPHTMEVMGCDSGSGQKIPNLRSETQIQVRPATSGVWLWANPFSLVL